jgi:hypothetical protein
MANKAYNTLLQALLPGTYDLDNIDLRVIGVTDSYTFSAAHDTMENANVPTAARLTTAGVQLTGETLGSLLLDATDVVLPSVPSGTLDALIVFLYVTSDTSADSIPLWYVDTGTGFPLTTTGNNVDVTFNVAGVLTIASANCYNTLLNAMLNGTYDLEALDLYAVGMSADYTFSAAHATMENANIPLAARVCGPVDIGSESIGTLLLDGADIQFPSVTGDEVTTIIIYDHNVDGESATDIPLMRMTSGTNLPFTPDGNNVVIQWSASGILTVASA